MLRFIENLPVLMVALVGSRCFWKAGWASEAEWIWGYRELHPRDFWHPNQVLHYPCTHIQLPAEVFPLWKEAGDSKQGP